MEKVKKLKSVYIDLEKRIFQINGESMPKYVAEFLLDFSDGEWSLRFRNDNFFSSRANKESKV